MALFIQLVDKHKWRSPVLYIHSDEEKALNFIEGWKKDLIEWSSIKANNGMPLGRLESEMAIVDLVHKLSNYYLETDLFKKEGKIQSWIRLYNENSDSVEPSEIKIIEI